MERQVASHNAMETHAFGQSITRINHDTRLSPIDQHSPCRKIPRFQNCKHKREFLQKQREDID